MVSYWLIPRLEPDEMTILCQCCVSCTGFQSSDERTSN